MDTEALPAVHSRLVMSYRPVPRLEMQQSAHLRNHHKLLSAVQDVGLSLEVGEYWNRTSCVWCKRLEYLC